MHPSGHLVSPVRRGWLAAGIVLVALNLRPALASVGPLLPDVRAATGLGNAALGLLTALPLVAFGALSLATPLVTRRLGVSGAIGAAMAALAAGIVLRSVPSVAALFGGTLVLGAAIAFGNVLLPALVKRDFADRSGAMTGLYSSAIGLGAALAAGVAVPAAGALGWRGSLGVWAAAALAALVVWAPQLRRRDLPRVSGNGASSLRRMGSSGLAWQVALYLGLQSFTFYAVLAWLPDLLQGRGFAPAEAGGLLALSQVFGIAGSASVPVWASRIADQRPILWALGAAEALALAGLLVPSVGGAAVWVSVLGFVLGASFGLSLLLLVLRTSDAETATALSGMAQSVGYGVAALGPVVFGALHDASAGWTAPLLSLAAVLVAKTGVGLGAARDRVIGRAPAA